MGRAFSNGTSWEMWAAGNCYVCANDVNEDCPIIAEALCSDDTPKQWTGKDQDYTCSEFRASAPDAAEKDGTGTPIQNCSGQLSLADAAEDLAGCDSGHIVRNVMHLPPNM